MTEEVRFVGHPNVLSMHDRTIEITTEEHLTPRGDCILGVRAAKGLAALLPRTKEALRSDDARVRFTLVAPGGEYSFAARGSKDLTFESATDMVIRKSGYVCGRTLAILSGASARQVPRTLVGSLKSSASAGSLRIEVFV